MPITYDSSTNTITIVGGSETSPYSFEDIYQADINGGWGKVSKPADHTYVIDCFLTVGNDSIETWFADENKQVNFRAKNYATSNGQYLVEGKYLSHIRFGVVVDENTKFTKNGCQFIIDNDEIPYWLRFLLSKYEVHLYSTSIIVTNRKDILGGVNRIQGNGRIWNCLFQGGYHWSYMFNTDVFNLTVTNSIKFIRRPDATTIVNRVAGFGSSFGIEFQSISGVVKDVYGRGIDRAFIMNGLDENDGDCYIINGDFDSWRSRWINTVPERKLFRQYTLNIEVVDEFGQPIEGARVVLKDKDGNVVFSETTDSEGKISEQTATYGYYQREEDGYYEHDEIFTSMSPHTLIITKDGFQEYKTTFELDKKIDWKITLKRANVNIDQEVLL